MLILNGNIQIVLDVKVLMYKKHTQMSKSLFWGNSLDLCGFG